MIFRVVRAFVVVVLLLGSVAYSRAGLPGTSPNPGATPAANHAAPPALVADSALAAGPVLDPVADPVFATPPQRLVSLYPTASEILAALGAGDAVAGITIHDGNLPGFAGKPMVGGFAAPDVERILALSPDCVVAAPFQKEAVRALRQKGLPVFLLDTRNLADGAANIRKLGALMGREKEAEALVAREQGFLDLVKAKIANLEQDPQHRPLRTMRFMGFADGGLLTPGDDSFQDEMIAGAGGRPPHFGQDGPVVAIGPEQWRQFDPEVVYICGQDAGEARKRLQAPAWAGVAAVKTGRVYAYPCDLTCRAATHYGWFSLWLSSDLYGKEYSEARTQVQADAITVRKTLDLPFDFVAGAEVLEERIFDFPAKTLVLRFSRPQTVLSSLTGWSEGITAVGNHYTSPPSWAVTHHLGMDETNARTLALLGLKPETSAFLYTGADMANLAYAERDSDGLRVGVLATAGVAGNAMRVPVDTGNFVEPGTINIIILTNRKLSGPAMSRALITATEAKTAALEDLDIRSSYSGTPATGTGTDNVLVVSGGGAPATMTGGHTKLGELTAKATYAAVREAIGKQNGLAPQRDIFQRLAEHKVVPAALFGQSACLPDAAARQTLAAGLEKILLQPRYAGFLEGALALSDGKERGLIQDTSAFSALCLAMAGELAGRHVAELEPAVTDEAVPPLVREALNALATGLLRR